MDEFVFFVRSNRAYCNDDYGPVLDAADISVITVAMAEKFDVWLRWANKAAMLQSGYETDERVVVNGVNAEDDAVVGLPWADI